MHIHKSNKCWKIYMIINNPSHKHKKKNKNKGRIALNLDGLSPGPNWLRHPLSQMLLQIYVKEIILWPHKDQPSIQTSVWVSQQTCKAGTTSFCHCSTAPKGIDGGKKKEKSAKVKQKHWNDTSHIGSVISVFQINRVDQKLTIKLELMSTGL